MASSSILPSTVVDYVDHPQHDAVTKARKETIFVSKLSQIGGIISSRREAFIRPVDSDLAEEDTSGNPEFKLPSFRSLFVIIGGNALFQVRRIVTQQ